MQQRARASSSALLEQLHWLPIEWRVRFKVATLTYKTLHTGRPPYLADLLQYHRSVKSTRSSFTQLLSVPRHNLSFGSRAFHVSAPKIWNSLPPQIRQSQSLYTFRRHLKTYLFSVGLSHPLAPHQCALILFIQVPALYKLFTYLLTYSRNGFLVCDFQNFLCNANLHFSFTTLLCLIREK